MKLLALDLMDTVVQDPFFTRVPRLLDRSVEQVFEIMARGAWVAFETGALDEAAYLARMYADDVTTTDLPPPEQVRAAIVDNYRFVAGVEQLLVDLQRGRVTTWALSNYSPWSEIMRRALGLDRYFAGYAISWRTGFRKPDPAAFRALWQAAGGGPDSWVFVDDRQTNIDAACSLGMDGVLFRDAVQLRGALRARGMLR